MDAGVRRHDDIVSSGREIFDDLNRDIEPVV